MTPISSSVTPRCYLSLLQFDHTRIKNMKLNRQFASFINQSALTFYAAGEINRLDTLHYTSIGINPAMTIFY